ncbi:helix-turn-helix domain-containing protein, partial [Vallitalea sediminicola]
ISSIERLFKKYFGLTPKAYSDIIRFKQSIISEDPKSFFYDQSHFIKSCKKYTLKSPKELGSVSEITLKY